MKLAREIDRQIHKDTGKEDDRRVERQKDRNQTRPNGRLKESKDIKKQLYHALLKIMFGKF